MIDSVNIDLTAFEASKNAASRVINKQGEGPARKTIREAFTSGKPFAIRLGSPSPTLLSKLPDSVPAHSCAGKPLIVTQDWLDRKRKDGTDHRAHFQPLESHPNDIPLTFEDLELLPSIWREPDTVEQTGKTRLMLSMKALDGGTYKAVVDYEKATNLKAFHKEGPRK